MATTDLLPDLPDIGLVFPRSSIILDAFKWSKEHTTPTVYNHAARSAYFSLIISNKLVGYEKADLELVVLSCVLHDMGWATTTSLLSEDKRFEVDGANIARDFIQEHAQGPSDWDTGRIQQVWYAIALHTAVSFARHATPEVALTHFGIAADFAPPDTPGGPPITLEEYEAVTGAFPRLPVDQAEIKSIMCGLCRSKPNTTYDNFVGGFGLEFGLDGEGQGREEYAAAWRENQHFKKLMSGMKAVSEFEQSRHK